MARSIKKEFDAAYGGEAATLHTAAVTRTRSEIAVAELLPHPFPAACLLSSVAGCWHCVVGRNFGSLVTHTSRTFIYLYLGQLAVLLFKSGSQAL